MGGTAIRDARYSGMAVDINRASQAELDAVEGPAGHGFEIVRYRDERGRFTDLRQLDEVPGLAGKMDETMKARHLTV